MLHPVERSGTWAQRLPLVLNVNGEGCRLKEKRKAGVFGRAATPAIPDQTPD